MRSRHYRTTKALAMLCVVLLCSCSKTIQLPSLYEEDAPYAEQPSNAEGVEPGFQFPPKEFIKGLPDQASPGLLDRPGQRIEGWVMDESSEPIPGAKVRLMCVTIDSTPHLTDWSDPKVTVSCDVRGGFSIPRAPWPAVLSLAVQCPDRPCVVFHRGPKNSDFTFRIGFGIPHRIRLIDGQSGKPAPGVALLTTIKPTSESQGSLFGRSDKDGFVSFQTPSGANAAIDFESDVAREYRFAGSDSRSGSNASFASLSFPKAQRQVPAPKKSDVKDQAALDIRLYRSTYVTLEAIDKATGAPVPRVEFAFTGRKAPGHLVSTVETRLGPTGEDGKFIWHDPMTKLFGMFDHPKLIEQQFTAIPPAGFTLVDSPGNDWNMGPGKRPTYRFFFKKD